MSVSVCSNNIADLDIRKLVEVAVVESMGNPPGNWTVDIYRNPESDGWHVSICGPDGFRWIRRFLGIEEQDARCEFVRETISALFQKP